MAMVSAALVKALNVDFKKSFQDALNQDTPADYLKIATVVKSSTASNVYGWLGQFPGFTEWVSDRVMSDMKAHGYSIDNKKWANGVTVARTDIEDDNVGIYTPMFAEMGRAAREFPNELVFPLLSSGFAKTCYDGQFFFDTDHPVYPEVDGTGTVVTVSNMTAGSANPWILIDSTRALKPIIYQSRKQPKFTSMTADTDEAVFTSDEYRYGVDLRSNAGYGFWQFAHGSKVALNKANFNQAYDAMTAITADGGRPMRVKPNILVVGNSNRAAADELINAREINGTTNVLYNKVEVVHTPWLV